MKRKVLFVIESLAGGGAEKVLSVITKHFNYEKYEVTVCPIVNEGIYCEDVRKQVTHYKPIISYKGPLLSRLWNRIKYKLVYSYLPLSYVYKWYVPQGNDIEIAFCEGYVTKLLSYANSKSKKIAWVHIDIKDYPWPIESGIFKDNAEERYSYSVYDKIVCVSQTVSRSFCSLYGLESNVTTIYNPIDVDDIVHKAGRNHEGKDNYIRLISVGRLVRQKGYDRLLNVIKRLYDNGYSIHLMILGEGMEREPLERFVAVNGMHSYVSLPGFSENPYPQMAESDLFVCSSRAEGFSLVIAEAMVLGIPVVSTYCSGPNELLHEGKYGLLVENSEEGLFQGIKILLDDPTKLKELRMSSLSRGGMFDTDEAMRRIEQMFEEE